MTLTSILGLFKPDRTDNITVNRDIGQNMDMIDDAYKDLQGLIAIPQNGDEATTALDKYSYIVRKNRIAKTTDSISSGEALSGKTTPIFANGLLNWIMITLRRFEFVEDNDYGAPNLIPNGATAHFPYNPATRETQMKLYLVFTTGQTEDYMGIWLWKGNVTSGSDPVVLPVAKSSGCKINVTVDNTNETTKNQIHIQNTGSADCGVYVYKIGDRDN